MPVLESQVVYDPFSHRLHDDPYATLARLREERPLYRNDELDFWAVSRFDDVRAGQLDWETFSSSRGVALELVQAGNEMPAGTIVFEDPPSHNAHRQMLSRLFSPRTIAGLEPQIRALTIRALDAVAGRDTFDFVADLGALMPMQVIGLLLGIPADQQQELRDRVEATITTEDGQGTKNPDFTFGVGDYVRWRLAHPGDDVVSHLAQATFTDGDGVTRRLTETELVFYAGLVAAAGNETTTKLIGWAGHVLARNPDQRRLLVDDPGLIPNAIEELLRYESPAPVMARYVTRPVRLHGEVVPEGSAMLLLVGAANRDPRRFDRPDEFDVRRQIDRHLAFGFGIHYCLGATLARLEGRVALEEILKRYPEWELHEDGLVMAHTTCAVRGWHQLPTAVDPAG